MWESFTFFYSYFLNTKKKVIFTCYLDSLPVPTPRCQNAQVPKCHGAGQVITPEPRLRILCTTRLAEGWDQPFLSTCLSPSPPDPHGKLRVSTCKKRLRSIENNTFLESFHIVRFIIAPLDWNITRLSISHQSWVQSIHMPYCEIFPLLTRSSKGGCTSMSALFFLQRYTPVPWPYDFAGPLNWRI